MTTFRTKQAKEFTTISNDAVRDGRLSLKARGLRSEEHTSELQSLTNIVCRLLLEKKKQLERKYLHILSHIRL